eukprot:PhM_4_TR5480/c0_g1_i1/m.84476
MSHDENSSSFNFLKIMLAVGNGLPQQQQQSASDFVNLGLLYSQRPQPISPPSPPPPPPPTVPPVPMPPSDRAPHRSVAALPPPTPTTTTTTTTTTLLPPRMCYVSPAYTRRGLSTSMNTTGPSSARTHTPSLPSRAGSPTPFHSCSTHYYTSNAHPSTSKFAQRFYCNNNNNINGNNSNGHPTRPQSAALVMTRPASATLRGMRATNTSSTNSAQRTPYNNNNNHHHHHHRGVAVGTARCAVDYSRTATTVM